LICSPLPHALFGRFFTEKQEPVACIFYDMSNPGSKDKTHQACRQRQARKNADGF